MEQDLIRKIKELKKIEPSREWLVSTRNDLIAELGPEIGFFQWLKQPQSFALATCLVFILLGGPWLTIQASKASLPGELLYSIKKISEDVQMTVTSENNKTQLKIEFAGRRLEELGKITADSQKNENIREIASELKDNLAEASVYANKISEQEVMAVVKKTQKIKEGLDENKQEASSEVQAELAEAGKAVEQINEQILATLNRKYREDNSENAVVTTTTTTDQEILIFLKELEDGTITTTDKVINGVEE